VQCRLLLAKLQHYLRSENCTQSKHGTQCWWRLVNDTDSTLITAKSPRQTAPHHADRASNVAEQTRELTEHRAAIEACRGHRPPRPSRPLPPYPPPITTTTVVHCSHHASDMAGQPSPSARLPRAVRIAQNVDQPLVHNSVQIHVHIISFSISRQPTA